MVQLVYLWRRPERLSREEAQRYWLDHHAPLVERHASVLGIKRYVQVHASADAEQHAGRAARGAPEPYDGVAELWFDRDLATGTREQRERADAELREDESKFIDFARSPLWMGEDHVIIERGGAGQRLTFVLRRRPELSREQFQRYWLEHHAPLVRETVDARVTRYVQVHSLPDAESLPGRAARGAPEPYDGVAELWIDASAPVEPRDPRPAPGVLQEDESKFIDFARSPLWMGEEHVIFER